MRRATFVENVVRRIDQSMENKWFSFNESSFRNRFENVTSSSMTKQRKQLLYRVTCQMNRKLNKGHCYAEITAQLKKTSDKCPRSKRFTRFYQYGFLPSSRFLEIRRVAPLVSRVTNISEKSRNIVTDRKNGPFIMVNCSCRSHLATAEPSIFPFR